MSAGARSDARASEGAAPPLAPDPDAADRTAADPIAADLERAVESALPRLRAIGETASTARPAPGKWSCKEVLGHLIDSASNNHQRFVRARFQRDLVFPGYDQDAWVAAQRYQEIPWEELVELWSRFNLHLAQVISTTPKEERTRERKDHNLDRIAFRTVPRDASATLESFMRDYVDHLLHHLDQIWATAGLSDA